MYFQQTTEKKCFLSHRKEQTDEKAPQEKKTPY